MKESGFTDALIQNKSGSPVSIGFFYCMVLLAVSMPLSEFGMSVSQFLLLGFWAWEGADTSKYHVKNGLTRILSALGENLGRKFRSAWSNKTLTTFLLIYFVHVAGILYSTNLQYALADIRVKLPLLSLPVIFATSEKLSAKRVHSLLLWFCLAVIAGSLISVYVLLTRDLADPREMSIYISHIRFALLISLSVFILFYFLLWTDKGRGYKLLTIVAIVWLMVFLLLLKSMTGVIITVLTAWILILVYSFGRRKLGISLLILTLSGIVAGGLNMREIYLDLTIADKTVLQEIEKYTPSGNVYLHDTLNFGIENGRFVGLYISEKELREEWNKRSYMPYDSLDAKGQILKYTLIRYLHSKELRKDSTGVNSLSDKDIRRVENGVANAEYIGGFQIRPVVEQLIMGFLNYASKNDANGSSMAQRLEYWKTSAYLIKEQPVAGYGTGDVADAFKRAYDETNSTLLPEFRHRSHNQFLAIAVALGVFGTVVFVFGLFYPILKSGALRNFLFLSFIIIALMSFLTEDTLETQAGATFFAFFYSLFIFKTDMHAWKIFRKNQ